MIDDWPGALFDSENRSILLLGAAMLIKVSEDEFRRDTDAMLDHVERGNDVAVVNGDGDIVVALVGAVDFERMRQMHEWVARKRKPTPEGVATALAILDRPTGIEPDEDDRLPEGYVSVRERYPGAQG